METVVVEGNVRTIETVSERTVSSKTVVQRTANTNSTQVNKYDAEGNLKSSTEVDKESWEERDTKSYEWSKPADRPPTPTASDGTVAVAGSDLSVEKFLQEGPSTDGATLVMTTSENVPGVQWSGTTVEQRDLPVASTAGDVTTTPTATTAAPAPATASATTAVVPDSPASTPAAPGSAAVDGALVAATTEVQASQRITTNVQGESSSRSGEVVWITETTKKPAASNTAAADAGTPAAILPVSAQSPPAEITVPVATKPVQQTPPPAVQQQPLSVEERRRNRCIENRARKAAVASAGIALSSA